MATNLSYDEQIEALLNAVNDYQSPIDTSPPVEVEDKYNLSWAEAAAQLRGIGYIQEHDWTEEDFSFIDPVTNETWYKNTIANDRPFYNLLAENMDKPFVSRLFDSSAPSIQGQDDEGNLVDITHLMASSDNLVYPTVVANPDNPSELIDLTDVGLAGLWEGIDPYDHAISSGNYIEFPDERNARAFGEHYKNFIPPKKEEDRVKNGWSKKKPIAVTDAQFVMGYLQHREETNGDGWDKLERINEEIPIEIRAHLPEGHRHYWEAGLGDIGKHAAWSKIWGAAYVLPSAITGPLESIYSKSEAILEADFGKLGSAVYDIAMGENPDEILNGFKEWRAETGRVGKVLDETSNTMELVQDYFAKKSEAAFKQQMDNPRWQAYNVHLDKIREKSVLPWKDDFMGVDDFGTYLLDAMSSQVATYGAGAVTFAATKSMPATLAAIRGGAFIMEGTDEWRQEYSHFRAQGLSPQEASERAWVGYVLYGTGAAAIEGWGAKQWLSPNARALLENDKKILWDKVKNVVRKVPKTDKIGKVFPSAPKRGAGKWATDLGKMSVIRPVAEYITEGSQRLFQGVVQERYTDVNWSEAYDEAKEEARAGAVSALFMGAGVDVTTGLYEATTGYSAYKVKKEKSQFDRKVSEAEEAEIVDEKTEGKQPHEVVAMATIDKFMEGDNFTEEQLGPDAFQRLENLDIITSPDNILDALKLGGEEAIIDAGYSVEEVLNEIESYYGESTPDIRAKAESAIRGKKTQDEVILPGVEESPVTGPVTAPEQTQVAPKVVIPGVQVATADDFDVDTTEDEGVEEEVETAPVIIPGVTVATADDFFIDDEDVPTEVPTGEAPVEGKKQSLVGLTPLKKEEAIKDAFPINRSSKSITQIKNMMNSFMRRYNSWVDDEGVTRVELDDFIANIKLEDFALMIQLANSKEYMDSPKLIGYHKPLNAEFHNLVLKLDEFTIPTQKEAPVEDTRIARFEENFKALWGVEERPALDDIIKFEGKNYKIIDVKDASDVMIQQMQDNILAGQEEGISGIEDIMSKEEFEQTGLYQLFSLEEVEFKGNLTFPVGGDTVLIDVPINELVDKGFTFKPEGVEVQPPVAGYDLQQRDIETQNKLEDVPLPRGYKHYKVAMADVPLEGDKRPKLVAGKPIKLKGSKREFFLYKDKEEYKVVDSRTGTFLGSWRGTQKDAIEIAQRNLDKAIKSGVYKDAIVSTERKLASRPQYQTIGQAIGDLLDEQDSGFPLISDADEQFQKIITKLKKDFPDVITLVVENLYDDHGIEVAGIAFESLVAWSNSKATLDTAPHEYFHVLFNALKHVAEIDGNTQVKELIDGGLKEFGWNEEELVQKVAELYTEKVLTDNEGVVDKSLTARLKTWLRKVWNAIKKAFGKKIKGKTYAEQLADIFFNATDKYVDVEDVRVSIPVSQLVRDAKARYAGAGFADPFNLESEAQYNKHAIGRVLAMQRLARLSAVDYSVRPLQELDKKFNVKKYAKGIKIDSDLIRAITKRLSGREYQLINKIVTDNGLMGEKMSIEDFKAIVLSYYFPLRIQRGMAKDEAISQMYTSFALDDFNNDYGEWSFKVPITVRESHPWFTKSDNNTIGWFRGDSNPENTKEFRLQELQSDTFQRDLGKGNQQLAILGQKVSKEDLAIQNDFLKNIGHGSWEKFLFNSVMQFLNDNNYSSVLIPYGNTVKEIQNFDKIEEKLESLPAEIEAQESLVDKLDASPEYIKALKEFKALAPKIKKLFNDNKLASIIAENEGEPTVWTFNQIDGSSWSVQWHYEPVEPTSKKEIANDKQLWDDIISNPYNYEFKSVAGMETYLHKTKDKNKTVRRWSELNSPGQAGHDAYWDANREHTKLDKLKDDLGHYVRAKGSVDRIIHRYDMFKKFILKNRKGYAELYTDDKGRKWVKTWLTEKDALAVPMYQQLKNDTEAWDKAMILIDGAYREMSNDAKALGKKLPLGDFVRVMNDELPDRASDVFNAWLRLRFPNGRNRLMSQTVEGPDGRFMSEGDFAKSFAGVYNDFEDGLSKIESDDYLMSAKHGESVEKVFLSEIGAQMSIEGFAKFMNAAIDADYKDWSTNELPRHALISFNALTPKQQLNLKRLYVRANSVVTANQGKVMNVRNNLIYNESLIGGLQLKGPVNPFNEETSSMREPKMIYEIANPDMKSRLLWLNKTDMFITTNRDPLDIFGTKDRTFIKGAPYTLEEWDDFEDRLNKFVYEEDDVFGLVPLFSRSEKGKLAFAAISKKQLKIASDPRILKAYWSAEIKAFKESNDSVEDIKAFKAQINNFNGYREGEQKFKDPQWLAGEIARYEAYKELMPLNMISDGANFFKRIAIVTTPVFTSPLMEDITGAYFDFNNITFVDKNGVEQKAVDIVPGFKDKMSYSDGTTLIGANTFNLASNAFGLDRSRKIIKTIVWKSDKSLAMKHEMQLPPAGLKLYEGYGTKAQKLVAEVRSDNNLYVGDKIVNMIFSDDEAKIFTGKSGDIVTVRANEIGLINYASKHGSAKYPIQSLNFVDNEEVLSSFNENVLPRIRERLGRMLLLTGHPKDNAERIYGWLKTLRSDDIMAPSNVLVEKNKAARLGMHSDNEPMLNVLMKTQLIEGALQADFTEGVQLHSAPDWTDVVPEGSVSIALEDARAVLKPYAQAKGLDLKVIGKDYLKKINQWLINNPIYVRVSRSPVVGINGAYPARVSELHDRGGQILLNTSQGYKNLEFDFDGDTIQLDVIDEAEYLALNEMLDKALKDGRVQAIDLNKYENDAATYSDLSKRENAYVLAEKFGTGARAIGEISNVQAVHGMLQHTFGYMEVTNDDGSVEYIHVKKYQHKELFEEGGLNEVMTIETQIRTWQQAALDNGKYLLLDAWEYSQEKLFRKLFTVTSLVDGKLISAHSLNDAQWDAMKPLVDMYKIPGRIRNGGTFNEQYRMDTQLIESQRYLEFTKDREGYYRRVLYSPENQPKDAGIAVPGEEVSGPVTVGRLQFRDAKAPIESVATALAEVWEPIQLNEPERITPARFIPLVYKSVHQQAMKLLDESKENAVDTWLAMDFTKADMIKHGMEGHEYAQELHNALVTALVPQTKKGTAVDIKWAQHSISAIASGRKTKTTRTKELPVGGTFQINGVEYIITAVEQKSLAQVIAHDYRDEGYNTPKELESALKNLGLKMDMGRKLNVHTFKEYKEDDIGGEFAGYVGPQSWGRNPVLQKFQLEFEEKFANLHPIAQEVATYSFLEGLPSINDKMEQVRGNNRNVLPPFSNKKTTLDATIMANYSMKYNDIINDREKRLEEPSHFSNLTTFKNIIRRACP